MICENCQNDHAGKYGSGRFCSSKCARGYSTKSKRSEINNKVSKKLKGHESWNKGKIGCFTQEALEKFSERSKKMWENMSEETRLKYSKLRRESKGIYKIKICKICNENKEILYSSRLCSDCKEPFRLYREKCSFSFNVYKYPDKFDLDIIKKYGWYSPKNSKFPNLNGISRDHQFSIADGFKQNIDPSYIRHPANCILLRHTDNQKKWAKSSISLNDLMKRIREFEIDYGKYEDM